MEGIYFFFLLIITIVLIGFFAGYEIAFISANRFSVELKKKQGNRSSIIISSFLENPVGFIGSCLIGLNFFYVVYGLLFSYLLQYSFWHIFRVKNEYLQLAVDTFFAGLVILILGEFIPKAIFRAKSDKLLTSFAFVANIFHHLFKPFASFFIIISTWMLKYLFNVRMSEKKEAFSHIDLEHFFQQTKDYDDTGEELNKELFENALILPTVKIRQCLVPRTEIEALEITTPIEDVKKLFIQTKLTRLIVYDENIDNIVGYIHQLDLFKQPAKIQEILLPIPVIPEAMNAIDLIEKFTKERKSIAWVVDEFGGTAGIVTMEDILEEIFGDIQDEYDIDTFVNKQLSKTEFVLSGRLELDMLNEKYKFSFNSSESETLSGFIINYYGSIPAKRETIIIGKYQFDILSVSDTRIETVKLKLL
ncbi:MAG: HlyC/CorC family transporter [Chitinophagaceae bacterium]|nr:HlyC/CorC family transporter [Chitinophagaceae bacterium]MCW5904503.1 HlyC/CorC family transporter [Chitinophagaceae bacterium]